MYIHIYIRILLFVRQRSSGGSSLGVSLWEWGRQHHLAAHRCCNPLETAGLVRAQRQGITCRGARCPHTVDRSVQKFLRNSKGDRP